MKKQAKKGRNKIFVCLFDLKRPKMAESVSVVCRFFFCTSLENNLRHMIRFGVSRASREVKSIVRWDISRVSISTSEYSFLIVRHPGVNYTVIFIFISHAAISISPLFPQPDLDHSCAFCITEPFIFSITPLLFFSSNQQNCSFPQASLQIVNRFGPNCWFQWMRWRWAPDASSLRCLAFVFCWPPPPAAAGQLVVRVFALCGGISSSFTIEVLCLWPRTKIQSIE